MERNQPWDGYAERRRGRLALGWIAAAVGCVGLWLRSPGGGSFTALLLALAGVVAGIYGVVAVLVRPRATPGGTAYLVLTPGGRLGRLGLQVTNPDATVTGRLVVSSGEVTWTVRGVRLRFPREIVAAADVHRALSLRPLGYLTLHLSSGGSVVGRVFQPGPIERDLRAAGYPGG